MTDSMPSSRVNPGKQTNHHQYSENHTLMVAEGLHAAALPCRTALGNLYCVSPITCIPDWDGQADKVVVFRLRGHDFASPLLGSPQLATAHYLKLKHTVVSLKDKRKRKIITIIYKWF